MFRDEDGSNFNQTLLNITRNAQSRFAAPWQFVVKHELRKEEFLQGDPEAISRHYQNKNNEADRAWERARQSGVRSSQFPVKMRHVTFEAGV